MILSIEPTIREKLVMVCSQLLAELVKAEKYYVTAGKYAAAICSCFKIPLLPMETPEAVAKAKLESFRIQLGFRSGLSAEDRSYLLEPLGLILGALRQAIASRILTREQRRSSYEHRAKVRNIHPAPLHILEGDPYAD